MRAVDVEVIQEVRYENIPSEEIDDIELVEDDFTPGTSISFTPTFKYLGTII